MQLSAAGHRRTGGKNNLPLCYWLRRHYASELQLLTLVIAGLLCARYVLPRARETRPGWNRVRCYHTMPSAYGFISPPHSLFGSMGSVGSITWPWTTQGPAQATVRQTATGQSDLSMLRTRMTCAALCHRTNGLLSCKCVISQKCYFVEHCSPQIDAIFPKGWPTALHRRDMGHNFPFLRTA